MVDLTFRPGDSCPACGSPEIFEGVTRAAHNGLVHIDGCARCQKLWERETRTAPTAEPCSSCAFLPGSPEFESGALIGIINDTVDGPGLFYCHRRVPFSIKDGHHGGYDHAMDATGRRCTNATVCASWLRARLQAKRDARDAARCA